MDKAEPEMVDALPSRSLVVQGGSIGPGVAAGESHSKRPRLCGLADEEIVSAIHLRGRVIDLASSMKKRPMKMLLNSSATGNFILDAMATMLILQGQDDEAFHELMLADGIVMLTTRYI